VPRCADVLCGAGYGVNVILALTLSVQYHDVVCVDYVVDSASLCSVSSGMNRWSMTRTFIRGGRIFSAG